MKTTTPSQDNRQSRPARTQLDWKLPFRTGCISLDITWGTHCHHSPLRRAPDHRHSLTWNQTAPLRVLKVRLYLPKVEISSQKHHLEFWYLGDRQVRSIATCFWVWWASIHEVHLNQIHTKLRGIIQWKPPSLLLGCLNLIWSSCSYF